MALNDDEVNAAKIAELEARARMWDAIAKTLAEFLVALMSALAEDNRPANRAERRHGTP